MTDAKQRASAKAFSEYWAGRGYEKGESQPFWLSLLRDMFGVEEPEKLLVMELDFLPLKTNANIVEGNALRLGWESVVEKSKLDYIIFVYPIRNLSASMAAARPSAIA